MRFIDCFFEILAEAEERVSIVDAVSELALPDVWVSAGLVRNTIWDHFHGKRCLTPLNDVDVVYFDADSSEVNNRRMETYLSSRFPQYRFSVKNQAMMHARNGHQRYLSSKDALSYWTETCTAIGVIRKHGSWQVLAPYGLDDLMGLVVRPTIQSSKYLALVEERIRAKRWIETWPKLQIVLN